MDLKMICVSCSGFPIATLLIVGSLALFEYIAEKATPHTDRIWLKPVQFVVKLVILGFWGLFFFGLLLVLNSVNISAETLTALFWGTIIFFLFAIVVLVLVKELFSEAKVPKQKMKWPQHDRPELSRSELYPCPYCRSLIEYSKGEIGMAFRCRKCKMLSNLHLLFRATETDLVALYLLGPHSGSYAGYRPRPRARSAPFRGQGPEEKDASVVLESPCVRVLGNKVEKPHHVVLIGLRIPPTRQPDV